MSQRKFTPVSIHKTLRGQLEVNWQNEYQNEYHCPYCIEGQLRNFCYDKRSSVKLQFYCNNCKKIIYLTCKVKAYIYNYNPEIECPNPLCIQIGHNGQKGWVHKVTTKTRINIKIELYKCRFCNIIFDPKSTFINSWIGSQMEDKLSQFSFDDDIWDLRHFYENPARKTLNFQEVNPQWYRIEVKKYLYHLLKSRQFDTDGSCKQILICLRHFGRVIAALNLSSKSDISRDTLILFLNSFKNIKNKTVNTKLNYLRRFFEWLDLETLNLIRRRDFLKINQNDPDWLDEVTRKAIKQNLDKIPVPIARHYLIQEYTAVRPNDMCQLKFDCLVEENGNWYIKFTQGKKKKWHKIPATREIRKIIEEQQQWIRKTFGEDYPYLFCHFRGRHIKSYPTFPAMKPLPEPPKSKIKQNHMVCIIRMLIENEDILDANGQKPHFTGRITRTSRGQEIRTKHGIEAARLYLDHKSSDTTLQHYTPPTREQVAEVDLPFQKLLMNPDNKFLPWQSLPESLLKNPKAHELDLEIAPRIVVYGHCALDPKTPCPVNLFPKCYGCSSFRPSTSKLPLYEHQYQGEQQRLTEAEQAGAELAKEEAKSTIEAMDKWLPELKRLANG